MTRRHVLDIEKGLACDRDYMSLAHFKGLGFLDTERKALRRPSENSLPKLAPYGADGNFGTHTSRFLAFGILEHKCNVTICFDFYAIETASEVIPFLLSCDSRIRLRRQRLIRRWLFPIANLRWRN